MKLLTTDEAATYLGYAGASSVRNLVQRGELRPDGRRGKSGPYLFKTETLEDWARICLADQNPSDSDDVIARGMGGHEDEKHNGNTERRMENTNVSSRPEDGETGLASSDATTGDHSKRGAKCTRESQKRNQARGVSRPSPDDYARELRGAVARANVRAAQAVHD